MVISPWVVGQQQNRTAPYFSYLGGAMGRSHIERTKEPHLASQDTWLELARSCCWGRELVTLPNYLREFTKAKQLFFPGRELRYL
jgi:hypothetical protein